jgi:hypothetical protein
MNFMGYPLNMQFYF